MKKFPTESSRGESLAPARFVSWISAAGSHVDVAGFEALCAAEPTLADELRELKRAWDAMAASLPSEESAGPLMELLCSQFGDDIDPNVSLDGSLEPPRGIERDLGRSAAPVGSRLLDRLRGRKPSDARYSALEVLGRGGMGVVYSVWDEDLRRRLAMKVIRRPDDEAATPPRGREAAEGKVAGTHAAIDPDRLSRFLEEAQITAQLNHPGIVPVHEIGFDATGRVFFTMRMVKGVTYSEVIEWAWTGRHDYSQTRALNVLVAACEALAYAHEKGVVHRDVKPSNIMVGRFGETYLMDWGLARVCGKEDRHDLRLATLESARVATERDENVASGADAPLITMDGAVVGTPAYMPPEQAFGKTAEIDARSDVYSVGAMLYQLLTRRVPYSEPGSQMSRRMVLAAVQHGPPRAVHEINPAVPAELQAICERAMARDRERRYPSARALADDLRAYLEHRVVGAYETGAVAEMKKWIERNRALAATLFSMIALLLGGSSLYSWLSRSQAEQLARTNGELSVAKRLADAATQEAEANLAEVLRLADIKRVRELQQRADELWPAWPGMAPEIERWIGDAQELVGRLDLHRTSLAKLREQAQLGDPRIGPEGSERRRQRAEQEERRRQLARLDAELAKRAVPLLGSERAAELDQQRAVVAEELQAASASEAAIEQEWSFAADAGDSQWRHDLLQELVRAVSRLEDPVTVAANVTAAWKQSVAEESAIVANPPEDATIAAMRLRIAHARWVESISIEQARDEWTDAVERIRSSPRYSAAAPMDFAEQLGLVPIGPDPESGLEEFWHAETGARPARDASSQRLVLEETIGLVFVLLPGGTFTMGSQQPSEHSPLVTLNSDRSSTGTEQPPHDVTLAPFFVSKYEMTQAQWLRVAGSNPSWFRDRTDRAESLARAVEKISWVTTRALLARMSLALPTEAQWEYGARAGTSSVFWCGDDPASISSSRAGNLLDVAAARAGFKGKCESWDDRYAGVAPAGSFAGNPWGLHDVVGNVWEWCEDEYWPSFDTSIEREGDGLRIAPARPGAPNRAVRGSGWQDGSSSARSSARQGLDPNHLSRSLGVRPVRAIDR